MSARHLFFSVLILAALLLPAGCAVLQPRMPVEEEEQQAVAAAFRRLLSEQAACPESIDVSATVTFKAWLQSGSLTGYLQAMEPGYLRYVAVNPWGQPVALLATDGGRFDYLEVSTATAYEGKVNAEAFEKYAPPGLEPSESFYWLLGSLPPGPRQIIEILREGENQTYWLLIRLSRTAAFQHRILFDPQRLRIIRHLLQDHRETVLLDVRYQDYQAPAQAAYEGCFLPGTITVESSTRPGRLILSLSDWQPASLGPADFSLVAPPGYQKVKVE